MKKKKTGKVEGNKLYQNITRITTSTLDKVDFEARDKDVYGIIIKGSV